MGSNKEMTNLVIDNYLSRVSESILSIRTNDIEFLGKKIKEINKNGGGVYVVGNGGSAALANHFATDIGVGALKHNKPMKIISLVSNISSLTASANDYGYENWVEKALNFYADKGDVVILISSSGTSKNIVNGANWAKQNGLSVITLSGFNSDNPLKKIGDINLWVDSKGYNIIEMAHHIWLVAMVDYIVGNIEYKAN